MPTYEDVATAADWLCTAFGFEERQPEDSPHGRLYRAEDVEGHRWMFSQPAPA